MFNNFDIEYFLNVTPPSENKTLRELRYLINRRPINLKLVKSGDDIYGTFVKLFPGNEDIHRIIKKLADTSVPIIKKLKDFHNRKRPHEIAIENGLDLQYVTMGSTNTPAYPSGHSAQAYLIGTYLSELFPEKIEELMSNAEMISISRINARVHYPSDKWNGEQLGKAMANHLIMNVSQGYNDLPFEQHNFGDFVIRIFGKDTPSEELKWHTDGENRVVTPLRETTWKFQKEDCLPEKINSNNPIFIKEGVYHRIIKGEDKLIIKIEK